MIDTYLKSKNSQRISSYKCVFIVFSKKSDAKIYIVFFWVQTIYVERWKQMYFSHNNAKVPKPQNLNFQLNTITFMDLLVKKFGLKN